MVLNREKRIAKREKGGTAAAFAAILLFLVSCSDPQPPPEFLEAYSALDKALTKERLDGTAFASRFPKPTAKQVVSYLLSQAGAEALQVSNTPLGEDVDPLSDVPVWPSSFTLWHTKRMAYGRPKQVILSWNAANDVIIANALVAGSDEPVFTKEWPVPQLTPTRAADPSDTREFQAF